MQKIKKAFSLIELLVVILVISILIGLLLPALAHTRALGRDIKCKSQLKEFGQGLTQFCIDHKNHLPGVYSWHQNGLSDWQRDWLSGPYGDLLNQQVVWQYAPEYGTLFEYVGDIKQLYRCPSLVAGQLGSGKDSNGKYDYTMIGGFSGADLDLFPPVMYSSSNGSTFNPIPFFVEEDPLHNLNRIDSLAGSFAGNDQLGIQHFRNSNYAAIDGSVQIVPKSLSACSALLLKIDYKGRPLNIAIDPPKWNWLGKQ